jgi:hypothetical protein
MVKLDGMPSASNQLFDFVRSYIGEGKRKRLLESSLLDLSGNRMKHKNESKDLQGLVSLGRDHTPPCALSRPAYRRSCIRSAA